MNILKIFSNPYDTADITDERLYKFATNHENRLIADNANKQFDAILKVLSPVLILFARLLGIEDTTENVRKGATLTVDTFTEDVHAKMKNYYIKLAAVFDENSPAMIEFYPDKVSGYYNITREDMPVIVERLETVANKYQKSIDAEIYKTLVGFKETWDSLRDNQEQSKGKLSTTKEDIKTGRQNVEFALLDGQHDIAKMFRYDEDKCSSYYNPSLLYYKGIENPDASDDDNTDPNAPSTP